MAGSTSQLTNQPLGDNSSFNGVFLVEYITIGILTIWFLFYFNRVFSAIVSYAVRLFTWHSLGIYLDIESLQISVLAGRVFFRGVRYHGENETIHVQGGYITWRYWLGKVKESELFEDDQGSGAANGKEASSDVPKTQGENSVDVEEQGIKPRIKDLPCRIAVKVSGVEAFCHNRSPAYDIVIDSVSHRGSNTDPSRSTAEDQDSIGKADVKAGVRRQTHSSSSSTPPASSNDGDGRPDRSVSRIDSKTKAPATPTPPVPPSILRLLPVHVEVNKAAMVLGNENTPSIITAKIDAAHGEFGAGKAQESDVFKILMDFDISHPVVKMKPNVDYKRPQLAEAAMIKQKRMHDEDIAFATTSSPINLLEPKSWRKPHWLQGWQRLPGLSKAARQSLESVINMSPRISTDSKFPGARPDTQTQNRWLGLNRYLKDEQQDDHDEWGAIEYAKASTIAELNSVTFKFFWDIGGKSAKMLTDKPDTMPQCAADINGTAPPEYGMELNVKGGRVFYGPWADRHRLILQQIFFPPPFADARPTPFIGVGETRLCTVFKLFLSVDADTILRVPFREPSKDWRFKDRAAAVTGQGRRRKQSHPGLHRSRRRPGKRYTTDTTAQSTDVRPYAWFDIKVQANSTISYNMDLYPCTDGYKNELSVNVSGVEIYSSLNHALLWRSRDVSLACQLPYPLAWNGLREWLFEINIVRLDLFLLRDHTFLLVDLIEDWSAGPFPEFLTFVPYRYILRTHFHDFKLYLNVNDANIVNNSDDTEDNDFVILYGRKLDADLTIPIDEFRPAQSDITFDVAAYDLGFELSMPSKNTLSALLAVKDVAQLKTVNIQGAYNLCSEVRPDLTETLTMTIIGKGLTGQFYGFFARQLAKIKENYFGDDVHFRTYEEFQDLLATGTLKPSNTMMTSTKSNNLDVILDIIAEDGRIMVPRGLYDCDEYLVLTYDVANVDLRVNNYYLELQVDSTPVKIGYHLHGVNSDVPDFKGKDQQITIDGVHVSGHRIFGLPPVEPAYVSNWDIDIGDIIGEFPSEFIGVVIAAANSVSLTITDEENGLPLPPMPAVPDTTFVRFQSSLIRLGLRVGDVAMLCSTQDVHGTFNDFAGTRFSQTLVMSIPSVNMACIDAEQRHSSLKSPNPSQSHGYLRTAATLQMVQRSPNFEEDKAQQQSFVAKHDERTRRAQFLLDGKNDGTAEQTPICLPSLPLPIRSSAAKAGHLKAMHLPRHATQANRRQPMTEVYNSFMHTDKHLNAYPSVESRLKSIFKMPHLAFDMSEPYLDDASTPHARTQVSEEVQPVDEEELFETDVDEDAVHTSLIVGIDRGIIVMCKPRLVEAVFDLMQTITPRFPRDVYDEYQVDTVSEVIALLTRKRGKRSILDMDIRLPFIEARFLNPAVDLKQDTSRGNGDEYQLNTGAITTMVRVKNLPERKHAEDLRAVHVTVASIRASVRPQSASATPIDAAIECKVDDVLLWLADSDRMIIHASHNMLEVLVASKDLQYLASLIHRTAITIDHLQAPFLTLVLQRARRRRFLIHRLVQLGEALPDPLFLTRPAYMIRSAKDHLRNSDSWKIIARLRWVLSSLDTAALGDLTMSMLRDELETPANSEAYVLSNLDHWRSWDALHVRESLAMRILFPSRAGVAKLHDRSAIPVSVVGHAGMIRLVVDTGQKRNEIHVEKLALALSITPPSPRSAMQLFQDYQEVRTSVIQVTSSRISVDLKWGVVDLADQIATLFESNAPSQSTLSLISPSSSSPAYDMPAKEKVHLVFATEESDFRLEAIHLSQSLASSGLKISVATTGSARPREDMLVNVIASANAASMAMSHNSRSIWRSDVTSSSVCVISERLHRSDPQSNIVRLSAQAFKGSFDLDEDLLGVTEAINAAIHNEAKHIQALVLRHSHVDMFQARQSTASTSLEMPITLYVALSMDHYSIRLTLLPDIRYVVEGNVARSLMVPDASKDQSYSIEFDLKTQHHYLMSGSRQSSNQVASLNMPPISGNLRVMMQKTVISMSATMAMEQIQLEGVDIYGIVALLGSPAVKSGVESINLDVATITQSMSEIQASSVTKSRDAAETRPKTTLIFDVAFILAGLAVSAQVPAQSPDSSGAEMLIFLGPTHLRAANRSAQPDLALPFPELTAALGQLEFQLQARSAAGTVSCGAAQLAVNLTCAVEQVRENTFQRDFKLSIVGPVIEVQSATIPLLVEVIAHLQNRLESIDLSEEKKYLRRLRQSSARRAVPPNHTKQRDPDALTADANRDYAFESTFNFLVQGTRVSYNAFSTMGGPSRDVAQMILSLAEINLLARSEQQAHLRINQVQLDVVPKTQPLPTRASNSALMPEVVFQVGHETTRGERHLSLHAKGKALDLQLEPGIVLPVVLLNRSLGKSIARAKALSARLRSFPSTATVSSPPPRQTLFGNRLIKSLRCSGEFAGAFIRLQGHHSDSSRQNKARSLILASTRYYSRYGQVTAGESATGATIRAPGLALKVRYDTNIPEPAVLSAEVRIEGSSNSLTPAVVPLLAQTFHNVKEVMREMDKDQSTPLESKVAPSQHLEVETAGDSALPTDPSVILGRTKLNVGFRICKQEFTMSCQPIAKVAASAKLEDVYLTINTVESAKTGNFFALSATFTRLQATLQHMYSREATFVFDVESLTLSMMNSKHTSGVAGISGILKINPVKAQLNAKQLQDLLLFREIWLPPEIRNSSLRQQSTPADEPQEYFVRRYHQIAASTAFPWNATVALAGIRVETDLGQAIGKLSAELTDLWASSKKNSRSQQTLCIGINSVGIQGTGRMSGFVQLHELRLRTSIAWAPSDVTGAQTPLIQGSIGFREMRLKAAFDYQVFAVAHITAFDFIVYNVRDQQQKSGDRLVALLDGGKVQVFCVAASAALAVSLVQAFERLVEEKKDSYEQSLKDIDSFLHRTSTFTSGDSSSDLPRPPQRSPKKTGSKAPIRLHTDVIVTLGALDVGAFPRTMLDSQLLRLEAVGVEARFAAAPENDTIHSGLGLTLGQVRAALAEIPRQGMPKTLGEIDIEDVVRNAKSARGGVILRVPRVKATMQTWQALESKSIDYKFKSTFEGKIDVGWNYSRISFIRGMWETHSRTLASRLGKPLPQSALKITAPQSAAEQMAGSGVGRESDEQRKITAVVNLPQSKYTYRALEPPVIDTPQLRDMGEATPPLEWIGLNREKLPNVTHQVVILTLLEVVKEVEDAYSQVLGSA